MSSVYHSLKLFNSKVIFHYEQFVLTNLRLWECCWWLCDYKE